MSPKQEDNETQISLNFPHIILHSPTILSSENVIITACELAYALKNPAPQASFSNISDSQIVTIQQLSNIFPMWQIMWRKEQTLHNSKQWKIRHCTSENAPKLDQTSSISTAQSHWRLWGEGTYKFSAQVPHVPIRSKHYSSWSPWPTINGIDSVTSKGGKGRAKFQLEIKRQ